MKTNVNIYSDGEKPVIEWNGEIESDDNLDLASLLDIALNDMEKLLKSSKIWSLTNGYLWRRMR